VSFLRLISYRRLRLVVEPKPAQNTAHYLSANFAARCVRGTLAARPDELDRC
jgi:hypothetical protein